MAAMRTPGHRLYYHLDRQLRSGTIWTAARSGGHEPVLQRWCQRVWPNMNLVSHRGVALNLLGFGHPYRIKFASWAEAWLLLTARSDGLQIWPLGCRLDAS